MVATDALTPEKLLEAVEQLSNDDFARFANGVARLHAQRSHRCLPERESELLLQINEGLPEDVWRRYHELVAKRKALTLTGEEHDELKELTNQVEIAHARRIGYLVELAQLRGKTPVEMMDELGIKPPGYE